MVSLQRLVQVVFFIIIMAAIFGLLWWLLGYLQLPAPFDWVARGVLAVGGVFALIGLLMELAGYPLIRFKDEPPK